MIKKSRIRNVKAYLAHLTRGEEFHVAFRIAGVGDPALTRAGFSGLVESGDALVPARVGPISKFNADGKWRVFTDQPKEPRFVRTIMWSWEEWHGRYTETRTEERDVEQLCYPREWIAAPGVELAFIKAERCWLVTPLFRNAADKHDQILHAINLCLELFGSCEFLDAKKDVFAGITVKRVHWRLLPPGPTPWVTYLKEVGRDLAKRLDAASIEIILDRQDTIRRYEPDEVFVGTAGFQDYLAYVFSSRGVVVLESIRYGNALYMFGMDWQSVSKLSKADIINGGLATRIVHATGWKARIQLSMPPRRKAK